MRRREFIAATRRRCGSAARPPSVSTAQRRKGKVITKAYSEARRPRPAQKRASWVAFAVPFAGVADGYYAIASTAAVTESQIAARIIRSVLLR